MTTHNGRGQDGVPAPGDVELPAATTPQEGVVLPANAEPWTSQQHQVQPAQQQVQPPAGQPWGQPWGPGSDTAPPPAAEGVAAAGPTGAERATVAQPLPPEGAPAPQAPAQPVQPPAQSVQLPAQPVQLPAQPARPPAPPAQPPMGPPAAVVPPSGAPQAAAPPPEAGSESEATQMLPPPLVGAEDGTQMLPPVVGAEDGTQLLPPVAASDGEATQYMPPVVDASSASASASAPETTAESTQKLRAVQKPVRAPGQPQPQPQPQPQQQAGPPPVTRQPPPEFESLFRADPPVKMGAAAPPPPGDGDPGSTQSLPLFDQAAEDYDGYDEYEPQGRAARRTADRPGRGRLSRPGLLIACSVVGVIAVGLTAGAMLSGGGDGGGGQGDAKTKASTAPAGHEETTKPPDPAEGQAKKLDGLLDDSNNSRSSVVRSVARIRSCKMLGQAATDLRSAAKQRNGLVTRLGKLKTDEIPNGAQLTSALTRAWKSSASADAHYASWADQAARQKKKVCHKGHARSTSSAAAGNRASGSATAAKRQAASLWNPTAQKYSLKERQFGEL